MMLTYRMASSREERMFAVDVDPAVTIQMLANAASALRGEAIDMPTVVCPDGDVPNRNARVGDVFTDGDQFEILMMGTGV